MHFLLDYDKNHACWTKCDIPLCDTIDFSLTVTIHHCLCQFLLILKTTALTTTILTLSQCTSWMPNMIRPKPMICLEPKSSLTGPTARSIQYFIQTQKVIWCLLGVYQHTKVHIELKLGANLLHHHDYPVPDVHQQTFEKEFDHIVDLGILEPCEASKFAFSNFIIPKKRWVGLANHLFMRT